MKLDEFQKVTGKSERLRDQFSKSAERWMSMRSKFRDNATKIAKRNGLEIESTDRLRSWISQTVKNSDQPELLKKIAERLPDIGDNESEAGKIADAVAVADNKTIREIAQEKAINQMRDMVSIEFFERALQASSAIGRLTIMGTEFGTGFLVGENILCTNHHVIADKNNANDAVFELNVEDNRVGDPKRQEAFNLDYDRFFFKDEGLDITFIAVAPRSDNGVPLSDIPVCRLIEKEGKIVAGKNVNIIQHPGGGSKVASFRVGKLVEINNKEAHQHFCYYSADTDDGSSGSPVFNDMFQIIAVHHMAIPKTNKNGEVVDINGKKIGKERVIENPDLVDWEANEGARTSRIVSSLRDASFSSPEQTDIRDRLIDSWR